MKTLELQPVREKPEFFDEIEAAISELFKKELYLPLLRELQQPYNKIENALDDLLKAIQSGRISYNWGKFTGKFSSVTSKEIKALGGKWKDNAWHLPSAKLPIEVKNAISTSAAKFQKTILRIDERLAKMLPNEIADKVKLDRLFDTTIWKIDGEIQKTLKGLLVSPKLTPEQRAKIAADYTNNMKLYIQKFTEEEIIKLREKVKKETYQGKRYEGLFDTIQKSYEVSRNKAKFLARQETNLLLAKFKEVRYTDAGVKKYKWRCVVGSANHPVRPMHKALDGKVFSWDNPPVTDKKGSRNNPGQDYNCRCTAIPIVQF